MEGEGETGGEGGLSTPLSFSLPISSCGRSPPCSVIRLRIGVVHPLMLSSASPTPLSVARPPSVRVEKLFLTEAAEREVFDQYPQRIFLDFLFSSSSFAV